MKKGLITPTIILDKLKNQNTKTNSELPEGMESIFSDYHLNANQIKTLLSELKRIKRGRSDEEFESMNNQEIAKLIKQKKLQDIWIKTSDDDCMISTEDVLRWVNDSADHFQRVLEEQGLSSLQINSVYSELFKICDLMSESMRKDQLFKHINSIKESLFIKDYEALHTVVQEIGKAKLPLPSG